MDQLAHLIIRVDGQGVEKAAEAMERLYLVSKKVEAELTKLGGLSKDMIRLSIEQAKAESSKHRAAQAAAQVQNTLIRERMQMERIAHQQAQAHARASLTDAQRIAAEARARILLIREQILEEKRLFQAENDRLRLQAQQNRTARSAGSPPPLPGSGGGAASPSSGSRWSLAPEVTAASFMSKAGPLGSMIGGALAANSILETIKEMENLEARLKSITGSSQRASEVFAALKILDRQLPHDIGELTNSLTLLVHSGFEPSERALRSLSSLSSYSTESMYDVVIAMQRATQGEFRNLKKYGIAAQAQGEQIKFTFNGVSEMVNKNSLDIQNYFIRLSEQGTFADATKNRMDTLTGSISNLQSAWMSFVGEASKNTGIGGVLKGFVEVLTHALTGLDTILAGITRTGTNVMEAIGQLLAGNFKASGKAFHKARVGISTFGVSEMIDYQAEQKALAARARLESLKAGAVDEYAEEQRKRNNENKIKELRDFKLKFASEAERLSIEGTDALKEIAEREGLLEFERGALMIAAMKQTAEKKLELAKKNGKEHVYALEEEYKIIEQAERTEWEGFKNDSGLKDEDRRDLMNASFVKWDAKREEIKNKIIAAEKTRKSSLTRSLVEQKWDENTLNNANKTEAYELLVGMKSGDEQAIFTEQKKMQDLVIKMTDEGSKKREDNLKIFKDRALSQLEELAERERNTLRSAFDKKERELDRLEKRGRITKIERDKKTQEEWAKYEKSVSEIKIGQGLIGTPDAGDAPTVMTKDQSDLAALSNTESKIQQEIALYAMRNEEINALRADDKISAEEWRTKMFESEKTYHENLKNLSTAGLRRIAEDKMRMQLYVLDAASSIADKLQTLSAENEGAAKAAFFLTKSLAIAQAIINTHLGMSQAYAMGPIVGIPAAAFIQGVGYTNAALIAAVSFQEYAGKYADGGIVPGSSLSGDNMVARVNSGEMILNSGQQRNLFNVANGRGGSGGGSGGGMTINIYNQAGVEVETQTRSDGKTLDVLIKRIKSELASDARTGKSELVSTLEQTHRIRRQA